jgi:hypothetical protein
MSVLKIHPIHCAAIAALVLVFAASPQTCRAADEVFNALTKQGIRVSDKEAMMLPKPILSDGMSAADQRRAIEAQVAGRYDWDTFTRKAVVAPFLLKISEGTADSGPIGRRIDLYFVAYGNLKSLVGDDYLQKQLSLAAENDQSGGVGSAKVLSSDELQKRGIDAKTATDRRWVAVTSNLLGKVRIHLTTENQKTESADSVLIASLADVRFEGDAEYANSWSSLSVDDAGQRQTGPQQAFSGLGSYVKATHLSDPRGAVFIEYHVAFVEPQGWFHGTNLLRSKLPIVAQDMVRRFRRSLGE